MNDSSSQAADEENSGGDTKTTNIEAEINLFIKHINAIGDVLIGLVIAMQELEVNSKKKLTSFEEEHCEDDEDDSDVMKVPTLRYREWKQLRDRYEHIALSRILLPRSLLVSLISQYDAYLGRLIKRIVLSKPEVLNGSEKNLSFATLISFKSISEAREHILEKEIEGVLRLSHSDQFDWMEKKFALPLRKDLKSWPSFIELTERRNLFVHTDGVVSSQYIISCQNHHYPLDKDLNEGKRLGVPQEYFEKAHSIILEIGVKLGHVLWRKLFPDEREKADNHLGEVTFDLIDHGKYDQATNLLDFICEDIKKFYTESHKLMFIINRAQAYKWNGNEEFCKKIMKREDWSAKDERFQLAEAVLSDNWKKASAIMRRIGNSGKVRKSHYLHWPLFKEFRRQDEFQKTYAEVFEEEFANHTEIKNINSIQETLDETE